MVQIAKPLPQPVVADESKRPSGIYPKDKAREPLFDDRYDIKNCLGTGGISSVHRAIDRQTGMELVVKIMFDDFKSNSSTQMLFVSEAQILAKLSDVRGVVRLLGNGTDDGIPYLALNLIEGDELSFLIRSMADSPADLLDVISKSCRIMAEVHRLGVIHRDLKPHNIMVEISCDDEWEPTIIDFGHGCSSGIFDVYTHVSEVIGTTEYASPEAVRGGKNLDHRADIYSMGAIIYEALSGAPPFVPGPASTTEEMGAELKIVGERVLNEAPRPISELACWIPEKLGWIVMKALAKDPADRFQTMYDLAEALASCIPLISNKDARTLVSA